MHYRIRNQKTERNAQSGERMKDKKRMNWAAVMWNILLFIFTASGSVTLAGGIAYMSVGISITGTILSMIAIWLLIEGIMSAKEE